MNVHFLCYFIQQQETEAGEPSYTSANVPPSKFPERHFCSVCGYPFFHSFLIYFLQNYLLLQVLHVSGTIAPVSCHIKDTELYGLETKQQNILVYFNFKKVQLNFKPYQISFYFCPPGAFVNNLGHFRLKVTVS